MLPPQSVLYPPLKVPDATPKHNAKPEIHSFLGTTSTNSSSGSGQNSAHAAPGRKLMMPSTVAAAARLLSDEEVAS